MPAFRSKIKPVSSVTATTASDSSAIIVSWPTPAASGQPLAGFVLYRNGVQVASLSAAVRVYSDSAFVGAVSYSYSIKVVTTRASTSTETNSLVIVVYTGGVTLSWTAPTTNTAGQTFNGSTNDRTLVGYRVYGKRSTDFVYEVLATVSAPTTSTTITGLASGTWTFYVVAYDGDGDESDASYGNVTKVIP